MDASAFRQKIVATMDDYTLALIVLLVREHYEHTGNFPTAVQIREKLKRPGA